MANDDLGFGRKTGHERGSGVAGIVLLDETDGGVDNKQGDDADKVLPIRRPPLMTQSHKNIQKCSINYPILKSMFVSNKNYSNLFRS